MPGSFADDQRRATRQTLFVAGPVALAVVVLAAWLLLGRSSGGSSDALNAKDLVLGTTTTAALDATTVPLATLPPTSEEPPVAVAPVPSPVGAPTVRTTTTATTVRTGGTVATLPRTTTTTKAPATTTTTGPAVLHLSGYITWTSADATGACDPSTTNPLRSGAPYAIQAAATSTQVADGAFTSRPPDGKGGGFCGNQGGGSYVTTFNVDIPAASRGGSYRIAAGDWHSDPFADTGRTSEYVDIDQSGAVTRVR